MTAGTAQAMFVGVDVGGTKKGFHAAALRNGKFVDTAKGNLAEIVAWIARNDPAVVAIDAPCKWSKEGGGRSSRRAERDLALFGTKISCFSTPTRASAGDREFWGWVVHGQALYESLAGTHPLFIGASDHTKMCVETFPQAVACALARKIVSAKQKSTRRREVLAKAFDDVALLTNIDLVDAGLCAVAAAAFDSGNFQKFGDPEEGFIVVPAESYVAHS
jgi:predicted nuclease with RNAse H fold